MPLISKNASSKVSLISCLFLYFFFIIILILGIITTLLGSTNRHSTGDIHKRLHCIFKWALYLIYYSSLNRTKQVGEGAFLSFDNLFPIEPSRAPWPSKFQTSSSGKIELRTRGMFILMKFLEFEVF